MRSARSSCRSASMRAFRRRSTRSARRAKCSPSRRRSKSKNQASDKDTVMEIGFIGLGNMGYPMARRLVEAGHKLIVYDTNGQMVSRLTNIGAVAATSAKDVADRVETVMASLPTPDIVLSVATGKDGVIEGKRVKRFLDLSTTGARMASRVAQALAEKNITGIDLPVSGGVGGAEKGTLAVMYA